MSQSLIENTSTIIQNQLNKFSDWILGYIPQAIKNPINTHLKTLKNSINNIYNNIKTPQVENKETPKNKKTPKMTALKGF